jgi:hypothetical protein
VEVGALFRRGHRRFAWVVLALLFCTAFAALQESFAHTDDGCEVELHCVACRWAFAANVLFVDTPTVAASSTIVEIVAPPSVVLPQQAPHRRPTSRGPPAA